MADKKRATRSTKTKMASGQKTIVELFSNKRKNDTGENVSASGAENAEMSTEISDKKVYAPPVIGGKLEELPSSISTNKFPSEPVDRMKEIPRELPARPVKRNYTLFDKHTAVHTASSGQPPASYDDIDISDEPVAGPSRIDLTKPSETTVFSGSNDPLKTPLRPRKVVDLTLPSDGGSRHDPIVLDLSSPVQPPISEPSTPQKPIYSIFTRPEAKTVLTLSSLNSPRKRREKDAEGPFPGKDSQHIRGPQNSYLSPPLSFPRRRKEKQASAIDNHPNQSSPSYLRQSASNPHPRHPASVNLHLCSQSIESSPINYLSTIPPYHAQAHAAIPGLVDKLLSYAHVLDSDSASQKLWVDKWRPACASHVLGNEQYSLYLRDWILALDLQFEPTQGNSPLAEKNGKGDAGEEGRGSKRPRVTRAVAKRKSRKKRRIDTDEENEWIVGSDEDEALGMAKRDDDDDDIGFCQKMASKLQVKEGASEPARSPLISEDNPPLRHDFDQKLSNTILLVGPPGCGKTAAVYACAAELDCEVFEVYPGIGKRSGASLDHLVGDVGKNHLVGRSHNRDGYPQTKNGLATFFAQGNLQKKGKDGSGIDSGHIRGNDKDESIDVEGNAPDATASQPGDSVGFLAASARSGNNLDHKSSATRRAAKVRQSMILLEEVDILFKEDSNFWPAVINLIKDCRRPVILTCNDVGLIPTEDLPLQTILQFQPCPSNVAATYMQIMCLAEGRLFDHQSLIHLYESTNDLCPVDLPDAPIHPLSEGLPLPDLRKCIHRLQLHFSVPSQLPEPILQSAVSLEDIADWSSGEAMGRASGTQFLSRDSQEQAQLLRQLQTHTDLASFADCYLVRGPLETPEGLTLNDHGVSPDDELGHTSLANASDRTDRQRGLEYYIQDEVIAAALLRLSVEQLAGDIVSTSPTETFKARSLFQSRTTFLSQMLDVLEWIIPLSAPLIPRPAVFLDYEPFIRQMVATDDMLERQSQEVFQRAVRMTRNSHKHELPVRWVSLSEEHQQVLKATGFKGLEG